MKLRTCPMPKKRQIPFLSDPVRLADGTEVSHWKPSPTLRAAGFQNVKLGSDRKAAIAHAMQLNEQVAQWRAGTLQASPTDKAKAIPRVIRFDELVRRYKASPDFTLLKPKTQKEYKSRLAQLERWCTTAEGSMRLDMLTPAIATDLRDITMTTKGLHTAASLLRVLRLLLEWARRPGNGALVKINAAADVKITTAGARDKVISHAAAMAIAHAATDAGEHETALAIELGFWMVQREGDMLRLGENAWQEIFLPNVTNQHRAQLVDARGRIKGFQVKQSKTGAWVCAPVPPWLHDRVEAAFKQGWLFPSRFEPGEAMNDFILQRRFRVARDRALAAARAAGNARLAHDIEGARYGDLRRSGMSFYSLAGAKLPWITAMSGHMVLGRKTILDTYMPPNTDGAAACVATGIAWLKAQQKRDRAQGEQ